MICLLINKTTVNKHKPAAHIISSQLGPKLLITRPANKLDKGIKPCEPTSMTLLTFPNLSFSVKVMTLVDVGILMNGKVKPIKSAPIANVNNMTLIPNTSFAYNK